MTWTILKLLEWSEDYLKKFNIEKPRIDSEILLAYVLHKKRLDLYVEFERVLSQAELAQFKTLIQRRAKNEPVQYILEKQEFWSLTFKVGPGVLIPRPETECIIEQAKALLSSPGLTGGSNSLNFLDIGTGSGAIAIALAKEFPRASLTAVDISEKALGYAKSNATTHEVLDRVAFKVSDLFLSLAESEKFDLIVSNPPYVTENEWEGLEAHIKDHEPKEAFISGPEGTDALNEIIKNATAYLKPKGYLILEFAPQQAKALQSGIEKNKNYKHSTVIQDYSNRDRVMVVQNG